MLCSTGLLLILVDSRTQTSFSPALGFFYRHGNPWHNLKLLQFLEYDLPPLILDEQNLRCNKFLHRILFSNDACVSKIRSNWKFYVRNIWQSKITGYMVSPNTSWRWTVGLVLVYVFIHYYLQLPFVSRYSPEGMGHSWRYCNTRATRGVGEASFSPHPKLQKLG